MPTPTFTFYDKFVERFNNKEHDLFGTAGSGADQLNWVLTNTAPNQATNDVLADITELSTSGGYTAGGQSAANVGTRSTGTVSVATSSVTWTGSSGGFTARYMVLINNTHASKALVGYLDYGSAQAIAAGEQWVINAASPLFICARP
jgi:hypothetical protein